MRELNLVELQNISGGCDACGGKSNPPHSFENEAAFLGLLGVCLILGEGGRVGITLGLVSLGLGFSLFAFPPPFISTTPDNSFSQDPARIAA